MTDRTCELVLGLRRLTENACLRGDDLKYRQREEDNEHLEYIDALLAEVQRLHSALADQRKRFVTIEHPAPAQMLNKPAQIKVAG